MTASTCSRSVLFVCLGNICRSPIAEAVLKKQLADRGLTGQWLVDSAALGPWHVGELPDPRALITLKKHGLHTAHRGRMVKAEDFSRFEFVLGMDHENISELQEIQPRGSSAHLALLGSYDKQREEDEIEDPYMQEDKAFEEVFQLVWQACSDFLDVTTSK